jgi:hypothetical protein
MATTKKSVFETLNSINVNDHTESKNGLTYLSWAWAWAEVKKHYPEANYTVYERPVFTDTDSFPVNYFTDGKTCWVKTGVTIEGIEHIEYLPVMDYRNRSISLENITSMDVNKAIQRSLTKCCARHGLGLYIYAGEDLPEGDKEAIEKKDAESKDSKKFKVDELLLDADITEEQLISFLKSNDAKFKSERLRELDEKYLDFVINNWKKLSARIKKEVKDA